MTGKGMIDAHTHMFPEDVIHNWNAYAERDPYFGNLTKDSPKSRTREAFATAEDGIREADKAGIEVIVMQGWYWNDMDLCRQHNDYMAELTEKYPGRYVAFGSINPVFGKEAVKEVERCYERGFAGIGELGPGGNGFSLKDPRLYDVLEAAEALHLPVNFHVGEPMGHVYAGKDLTPIEGFYDLAVRYPKLKLIFAHMGGGLPFYEILPEVKEAFRNVYYDLAANPLLYDIRSTKAAVRLAGAERILFGTDFPLTIYPEVFKGQDLTMFVEDIRKNAGLTPYERERVMGENMRELISVSGRKYPGQENGNT